MIAAIDWNAVALAICATWTTAIVGMLGADAINSVRRIRLARTFLAHNQMQPFRRCECALCCEWRRFVDSREGHP